MSARGATVLVSVLMMAGGTRLDSDREIYVNAHYTSVCSGHALLGIAAQCP